MYLNLHFFTFNGIVEEKKNMTIYVLGELYRLYSMYRTISSVRLIVLLTLEELYSLVVESTAFGVSAKKESIFRGLDTFKKPISLTSRKHVSSSKFLSHCGTPKMCLLFLARSVGYRDQKIPCPYFANF